jgi:hypothetical protein
MVLIEGDGVKEDWSDGVLECWSDGKKEDLRGSAQGSVTALLDSP